jgi:catechol 2,3-dioxygenase-like lactoylglutathione lyase family enzyme
MKRSLGQIALVVRNYDEAIEYFTKKLGFFTLIEDTRLSEEKRWVVIGTSHKASAGCNLLLARAATPVQEQFIGNQTGGRVFLFLYTDDLNRDYKILLKEKITIVREPSSEEYGRVLVFQDLYGNLWDLIEPTPANIPDRE